MLFKIKILTKTRFNIKAFIKTFYLLILNSKIKIRFYNI